MATKNDKKTTRKIGGRKTRKSTKQFDCEEVEKYIENAIKKVKDEMEIIDKRDKEQYDAAKKIIIDANTVMQHRQEHVEKVVDEIDGELNNIVERQDGIVNDLKSSLNGLHNKLDKYVLEGNQKFADIKNSLIDIRDNGSKLSIEMNEKLSHVKVNGGVYPFNEAIHYVYKQQEQTNKKLDEVFSLVEPIRVRKKWMTSTRELINKSGFLQFFLKTKLGIILTTIFLLLFINTILVDVFKINLDLGSILKFIARIFTGT